MLLTPSLIPTENEIERTVSDLGFQYKEESNNFHSLNKITPGGLPMTIDCVMEGVKSITNFAGEMSKKGFKYIYYHIIICSSNCENEIIELVKTPSFPVKTYIIIIEKDPMNQHKVTIKCEDNMKTIILHLAENDMFKLKDFIKFSEIERKAIVFNVEASSFINEKQWEMICEYIKESTSKLKMFDVVTSIIFNGKIIKFSNQKPEKEELCNYNVSSYQVNYYLYE
jgi:hypothetical protein